MFKRLRKNKGGSTGSKAGGVATAAKPRPATGKKGRKDKSSGPAAPLHDRRRRLVSAHDAMLKDLGGLLLEMYKRNMFREELLLDKCEESLAIEVEIAHVDQRLFQLGPTTVSGQRPIGRCECGAPVLPGQNFCGVCGRSFTTLTQSRTCERCSAGLRIGDAFCWSCGTSAPDRFAVIGRPAATGSETTIDSTSPTPPISMSPPQGQPAAGPELAVPSPPVAKPKKMKPSGPDARRTQEPPVVAPPVVAPPVATPSSKPIEPDIAAPDPTQIIEVRSPRPTSEPSSPSQSPSLDAAARARASLPPDLASPPDIASPPEPDSAKRAAKSKKEADSAASEAERKRLEKVKKVRAKEMRARAKERAKAARKSRKRGGE